MKTINTVLFLFVVGCNNEFVDLDGEDCEPGASRCTDSTIIERCEDGAWVAEDCRDGCPLAFPVGICESRPESGQSNCGCYEAPACPRCWPYDGPPMMCCFNDDCTIARIEDDGLPVCLPPLSGEAVCELGVWLCRP